jgi:hypothetical protein
MAVVCPAARSSFMAVHRTAMLASGQPLLAARDVRCSKWFTEPFRRASRDRGSPHRRRGTGDDADEKLFQNAGLAAANDLFLQDFFTIHARFSGFW